MLDCQAFLDHHLQVMILVQGCEILLRVRLQCVIEWGLLLQFFGDRLEWEIVEGLKTGA